MKVSEFFSNYTELVTRIVYNKLDKDTGIMRQDTYVVFTDGTVKIRMRLTEYQMAKSEPGKYIVVVSSANSKKPYLKQAELGMAKQVKETKPAQAKKD